MYCRMLSLEEAWDRQSLIGSKLLPLPIAHHLGLSMYKVLLDSDKCLLNYSKLINLLEPDVQHMTSQILLILIDFYPDLCTIFFHHFPNI